MDCWPCLCSTSHCSLTLRGITAADATIYLSCKTSVVELVVATWAKLDAIGGRVGG